MKVTGRIDREGHSFNLGHTAETPEEAAVLYEASKKTHKPVRVMGSVGDSGVWESFSIPIEKREITPLCFNNDK